MSSVIDYLEPKTMFSIAIVVLCFGITYAVYRGEYELATSLITTLGVIVSLYKKLEKEKVEITARMLTGTLEEEEENFFTWFANRHPVIWTMIKVLLWILLFNILSWLLFKMSIFDLFYIIF